MFKTVKVGDINTHKNENKEITPELYNEEIQKIRCPCESLDGRQIKPFADFDGEVKIANISTSEKAHELKLVLLKAWDFIPSIDYIKHDYREIREKNGISKYSIHFIVNDLRCSLSTLRDVLEPMLPRDIFDKSVYSKNRGMHGIYTNKKLDRNNNVISVPKLLPDPDETDFNICNHLITYIEEEFKDVDLMYKDDIDVLEAERRKKEEGKAKSVLDKLNKKLNQISSAELSLYNELVKCLSTKRADEYDDWMHVGWTLFNINDCEEMLNLWIEFSKKSKSFTDGECENLWSGFKCSTLTVGTLKYQAKLDNPEEYKKVIAKSLDCVLVSAIRNGGNHFDVAKVAFNLLGDKLKYDDNTKCWYYLNDSDNIWKESKDGIWILSLLATDVCSLFIEKFRQYMISEENASASIASKISLQLKNTSFAESVKRQMKTLFNEYKFYEKCVDKKIHLFAFNNKVYDLDKKIFRNIEPEDYIMTTCGFDWDDKGIDIDKTNIYNLINQIQPHELEREYFLKVLASRLYGKNFHQEFYVWTGSGANGKSLLINLISSSFGNYHKKVNSDNFTKKSNSSNSTSDMANAFGCRIVTFEEPEDDEKLQSCKIKELSGDSEISVRGLFKEAISFVPQFAVFGIMNDMPTLTRVEPAIKRRFRVIDFPTIFTEHPKHSYERKIDVSLNGLISNNVLFKRAFIGILIDVWEKHDLKEKFKVPHSILSKTTDYFVDTDFVANFIIENYEFVEPAEEDKETTRIRSSTLYDDYRRALHGDKPMNTTAFKKQVERLKFIYHKDKKGAFIKNIKRREEEKV